MYGFDGRQGGRVGWVSGGSSLSDIPSPGEDGEVEKGETTSPWDGLRDEAATCTCSAFLLVLHVDAA